MISGNGFKKLKFPCSWETCDDLVIFCTYGTLFLPSIFFAGNILAFVALQFSTRRASSSHVYLRALAIGDLFTLIFSAIPSFLHFTVRPIFPDDSIILTHFFDRWGICLVIVYICYATRAFATYIIVLFSLERCATIIRPFKANTWFTPRTARRNVAICFVFAYTWALPGLFAKSQLPARGPYPPRCRTNTILFIFLQLQLYALNLLPIIIVLICNILIVIILRRRARDLNSPLSANKQASLSPNQSVNEEIPLSSRPSAKLPSNQKIASKQEQRVTRRLLIISSAFVVLIMPVFFVNLGRSMDELSGAYRTRTTGWANAIAISMTFWVTNFSINFILYCFTWRHFRRACYAILTCNKQQLMHLSTYVAQHQHQQDQQQPTNSPLNSSSTKSTFLTTRIVRTPQPSSKLVHLARQTAENF